MTAAVSAAEAVCAAIRRVEFGPMARFANVSVVPLLDATETDAGYLTLDGEELVGAKQNRVANLTILLPSGGGRWCPCRASRPGGGSAGRAAGGRAARGGDLGASRGSAESVAEASSRAFPGVGAGLECA